MRIRSTRPEFWRSKTIASLSWDVRLVLKGIESYVDDNGVGKDDIALIAADVFPRDLSTDPSGTLMRLQAAVNTLCEGGLIARYVIDGERLLYVDRWSDIQYIQRPTKGRFPRPDGTFNYEEPVNPDSYRKPHEDVRTKAGEQGSRGAGDSSSSYVSERAREKSDDDEIPGVEIQPLLPTPQSYPMTTIPDDWAPNDLHHAKWPRPDLDQLAEAFTDHATATGRLCNGRPGWDAAFNTWVRKAKPPEANGSTTDARILAAQALKDPERRELA